MIRLYLTATLLILAALGGAYAGFRSGVSQLETLAASSEGRDAALTERLGDLESTVLLLAADTASLRTGQETYVETQSAEKEALEEALVSLATTVGTQEAELETLAKSADVSGLIAEWSPYVYDITCSFEAGEEESESSASALVERKNGMLRFITNKHVVETDGEELIGCELDRPGFEGEIEILADAITLSETNDAAYGTLGGSLPAIDASRRCASAPGIGARVVILGFPQIGAKESVTATEGIISGFDEDYYTTSAKIEKGNSGGAAVDAERNCFLGLPTLVFTGRIESLARILPASSLE